MLDYLSPQGGSSPQGGPSLSDMMAQAMPSAVPGAPPPSSTGMVAPIGGAGAPPPPSPPPVAPGVIAPSGPIAPSMMPPPPPTAPGDMQYASITQADGSVLLHIKNPDGSLGPAVKIIPAPKQPKQAGGPPGQ